MLRLLIAACVLATGSALAQTQPAPPATASPPAAAGSSAIANSSTTAGSPSTASPSATTSSPAITSSNTPPSLTGILQDPADRERYQRLAEELRCLVCQNQTLADSGAELALDLRHQVESMIAAGRSNDEIKHFLVERYGDFVLYKPPVQSNTWALWVTPFALLLIGAFVWWRVQRRPRPAMPVDESEVERARHLLGE
ncbi:MAG: cytochrome c-type biogenesis protein CcmH [Burkholderiales bacterium]|nr:cytochrome c-type biogenesis protein CcmH [Burkholderiales bacterium]